MEKKTRIEIAGSHHRLSDFYFLVDERMIFTFIYPKSKEFFGDDPQELLGKSCWSVFPLLKDTQFAAACSRALKRQRQEVVEEDFPHWQGRYQCHVYPVSGGLFITFAYAAPLKRSKEGFLRDVLEHVPDAISTIDLDTGKITFRNCENFCGYALKDLMTARFILKAVHEDDLQRVRTFWERIRSADFPDPIDYRLKGKNGNWLWIQQRTRRISQSLSGAPEQILITLTDITQERLSGKADNQSEARFRQLIENAPDVFFQGALSDGYEYGILEYISPQVEELTGRRAEEIIQSPRILGKLVHPEDMPELNRAIQKLQKERASVSREYRLWNEARKQYVWISDRITPRFDQLGNLIGYQGVARDVTGQKLAEEALRDSEQRYQLISSAASDYLFSGHFDANGQLQLDWTAGAVETISGYSVEEYVARGGIQAGLHPDDLEIYARDLENIRARQPINSEFRTYKNDGEMVWVKVYANPVLSENGQEVVGLTGAVQDITERKLAEQALVESEANLKEAQTLGKVGSWKYHLADQTVTWSDETYRLYERDPSLGPPTAEEEAAYYTTEQAQILREYMRLIATEGREAQCDLEVNLPSGRRAVFFIRMRLEKDESGQPVNIFGTVQDITERKRAEDEIKQRLDELVTVNRISTVLNQAHSLNEMLPNLLDETLALLKSDTGAIFLADRQDNRLYRATEYGWRNLKDEPHPATIEAMVDLAFTSGETKIFARGGTLREAESQDVASGKDEWSCLCEPIRAENAIVGVIFAVINFPLSTNDLRLLTTISGISGNAILRVRLHEQTLQQMQRLTALHEIDLAINSVMDLDLLLFILLSHITSQLHVDAGDILQLDPVNKRLEFRTGIGFRTKDAFNYHEPIGNDLIGQAVRKNKIVFVSDVTLPEAVVSDRIQHLQGEDFKAHIAVPIIIKNEIKGVLELFHRTPFDPDPDWLNFLDTLVGQTAIAMDSAMMFEDLVRTNKELAEAYDATIEGWAMALDLRDMETTNHTKRVAEITVRLARQMGIDDEQLIHIRRGALLHDIGKLSVPDHVLFKPGSLSPEELEIMQRHPQQAFEMLYPIEHLRPALDIPYCHHEKWDGTGYPRGLKGEEIPFAARIFAVADVFDALTSERPYRKAWPPAQALTWIYEQAGKHFDPKVVGIFLSMFHTGRLSALP